MTRALEELKLLLLQDVWIDHKESLFEVLQLLINVAEMKVRTVNQISLSKIEPIPLTETVFHDDLNVSNYKIVFGDSEDDDSDEDNKTETYYTADENYDVSV